jgi:hypothetical protein
MKYCSYITNLKKHISLQEPSELGYFMQSVVDQLVERSPSFVGYDGPEIFFQASRTGHYTEPEPGCAKRSCR